MVTDVQTEIVGNGQMHRYEWLHLRQICMQRYSVLTRCILYIPVTFTLDKYSILILVSKNVISTSTVSSNYYYYIYPIFLNLLYVIVKMSYISQKSELEIAVFGLGGECNRDSDSTSLTVLKGQVWQNKTKWESHPNKHSI